MKLLLMFALCYFVAGGYAQPLRFLPLAEGTNTSIRGMSIATDNSIWVSGSNGMVGVSVNGGQTWQWKTVKGFETSDFRDIHAMDSSTAVIMAVDNPAYILKTINGGVSWKVTFEKSQDGMFLDAMHFKNDKEGICIGDPLILGSGGRRLFYLLRSHDGGDSWTPDPLYQLPPAQPGEAIFSASGTNIAFLNTPQFDYSFVTGGTISNLYLMGRPGLPNKKVNIPINQGVASSGTFSMATDGVKTFYCVGGDYKEPDNQYYNFYYTKDSGKKWASSSIAPPFGYRSCVALIDAKQLVACGTNGVDFTKNGGKEWKKISDEGFNVCMVAADKHTIYFAGGKGKIARLTIK